ncbi:MAG: hypothetical protein JWO91_1565, partial [Acidobacteriaceae bacterium]|nr:hypothetical protein [Acidobacteriaceae bacterium]
PAVPHQLDGPLRFVPVVQHVVRAAVAQLAHRPAVTGHRFTGLGVEDGQRAQQGGVAARAQQIRFLPAQRTFCSQVGFTYLASFL